MRWDLLIRGGTVVGPAGAGRADVAIVAGRIGEVAPELAGDAAETIDATGCHVLPGVVDPHVHFNDPGRSEWEGFASGSTAFAAGGGTLFVDMPLNASPPTLDAASFDAKLAAAQGAARTDFALWGGLVPGNVDRLPELAARGVAGFKAFMSGSGIGDFQAADDATLWQGMKLAGELGLPVLVHAENDALTAALARDAVAAGRTGIRDYLASRPVVAEVEAIRRAITLAADAGCPLHVVHVSSGTGVAAVVEARARGVDVTCETCPHYLVLTEDDVERIGAAAKCAPPLRPAAVQAALLAEIATKVDALAGMDPAAAGPQWGALHKLLLKAKVDPHAIMRLVTARDAAQAALMLRWLKGEEIEVAAPVAAAASKVDPDVMKAAMKAFRKRLKFARLDAESRLGVRPTTTGKKAEIDAMIAPSDYPRSVWEALVAAGRLRSEGGGFYALVDEIDPDA